jgi:hypothetical protein
MKGDFSRSTFDPKKHYTSVLMQQGRVQVDADWNEQQALHQYRIKTETEDVIGLCGVPEAVGGFELSVLGNGLDLSISAGRIYVDGILCELEKIQSVSAIELEVNSDKQVTGVKVSELPADPQAFYKNQWIEISGQNLPDVQGLITDIDTQAQILRFQGLIPNQYVDEFRRASDRQVRGITTYTHQPDYPNPTFVTPSDNTNPPKLSLDTEKAYLIYLDVWQRHITTLDDSHIREVALGGPDTSTRLKTVWQVKLLEIASAANANFNPAATWEFLRGLIRRLQPLIQQLQQQNDTRTPANTLSSIRQQIEDFLSQFSTSTAVSQEQLKNFMQNLSTSLESFVSPLEGIQSPVAGPLSAVLEEVRSELAKLNQSFNGLRCNAAYPEWDELTKASIGKLNARTQAISSDDNPCLIPPEAGYQRLENQLYRVEIHNPGSVGTATFKWSRDNGTVVTPIFKISGNTLTVGDLGPDDVLGFANGQWVEISDDRLELNGQTQSLIRITSIDPAQKTITLETTPPTLANNPDGVDLALHPKLRRWDQVGTSAPSNSVTTSTTWQDIEGGIQVQFPQGNYATGDYWLIPARTVTGEIEWPPYGLPNSNPIPQLPLGIRHHYCKLAILEFEDSWQVIDDCRQVFPPLTQKQAAIHVTETSWNNDDLLIIDELIQQGLQITLDAAPLYEDQGLKTISRATLIVTIETSINNETAPTLDLSFILDGTITVSGNTITWHLVDQNLINQVRRFLNQSSAKQLLIRLLLKGHAIWQQVGDRLIYLDGQAFGKPDKRADGTTPCTGLQLPSGAGARASDFESWFWLSPPPPPQLLSLTVNPNSVTAGDTATGTVTLTAPAPSGGLLVTLSNNAPTVIEGVSVSVVTIPPSITVATQQSSATFNISTTRFTAFQNVVTFNITASLAGVTKSAPLTVIGVEPPK